MPANSHQKIRGFTLIEIIIALFIFSIVSLIVVSALHNVLTTQSATEKKAVRLAQLQIALLLISRDLEQVINRPITTPTHNDEGFIGATHAVTLTRAGLANPFGQLQRSTLQRVSYQLQNDTLVRLTWPMLDLADETKPDVKPLLNSVTELNFEYLDNKYRFQKIWPPLDQPKAVLPMAVRITITLKDWGKIYQLYIIPGQIH